MYYKNQIHGTVIATLIFAFLTDTLSLLNVDTNSRKIVTGFILIMAVLIPNVNKKLIAELKLKFVYKGKAEIAAAKKENASLQSRQKMRKKQKNVSILNNLI